MHSLNANFIKQICSNANANVNVNIRICIRTAYVNMSMIKIEEKVISKKSESKYVSALPKILNGQSLLT